MELTEAQIQRSLILYIKMQYPNAILIVNPFSSFKLEPKQIKFAKQQGFESGQPDLMFVSRNKEFCGLAIELKRDKIVNNEHTKRQREYLEKLRLEGWQADFCIGYDNAKLMIDNYFQNK